MYNPREISVEVQREAGARAWLSGRECLRDRVIRLKGGFYPFLVECRLDSNRNKPVVPVIFREVADPDVEQSRWQERIRRNEALLRRIGASGPTCAWARELLDAAGRRTEVPQAQ